MATINLTEENFEETIENNDIVVVDFWATWCGPCRAFGPVFEKASEKHEGVTFGKVNTQEQQALAGAFNITSIPTLMVFRDKILVFAQPGMLPGKALDDLINKVQMLDMDDVRARIAKEDNMPKKQAAAAAAS